MLIELINWIKKLLGLDKDRSPELQWLENKKQRQEEALKEIENEKPSIDDINDHFNK